MCSELDLLLSDAENAAGAPPGAPRTIERSPRNLIGEARAAFDAGARELTGIAATGGKDHPTARLSGPGPGQVWHRVQELAGRARTRFPRRVRITTLDPLPGTARTPSLGLVQGRNQRARGMGRAWLSRPGRTARAMLGERASRRCPHPTGVS